MCDNSMQEIIDRIKNRRNELGFSYQDLANATGISKSTLQRYETGFIRNIPLSKINALANALQTTPAYIMEWPKNINQPEEIIENPDIRMIVRAGEKMTAQDAESLRKLAEYMFPYAFYL